jgi:hypothetical protein
MNKKAQDEIFLIGSLLIPVLIFIIALIVLYTNIAPLFVSNVLVFVYTRDTGVLTEVAYSMPDDIIFRYKGPLECKDLGGLMQCPRGDSVIEMENPLLTVYDLTSKADPTLRDSICERVPFYSQNNITWQFIGDQGKHEFNDPPSVWSVSANRLDYLMMESNLEMPFHDDSVEISKKRRELFDSLSADDSHISNMQDVVGAAISSCKNRQDIDLDYTNIPHYRLYSSVDDNPDSDLLCVQKFSIDPLQCDYDNEQDCVDANSCSWKNLECVPLGSGGSNVDIIDYKLIELAEPYEFINVTCFNFAELEEITDCTFDFKEIEDIRQTFSKDNKAFNTDCSHKDKDNGLIDLTFFTPKYSGTMKQTIHFIYDFDEDPSTNDIFIKSTFWPTSQQLKRAKDDHETVKWVISGGNEGRC